MPDDTLEREERLQGMGASRKRKEDARFIRGQGSYVDDIKLPGMLFGAMVRSPYAHARIKSIDKAKALAVPGVVAVLTVQCQDAEVLTIEGFEQGGALHALQEGFSEQHGLQCGYCTPGMLVRAYRLLKEHPDPSEQEIRAGLSGNLCRCTGYQNIVKAVQHAAKKVASTAA